MLSSTLLLALAAPLAAFAAPTSSSSSSTGESTAGQLLAAATGSTTCPEGYEFGTVNNVAEFAAPMKDIQHTIKSFFSADWEGFNVANTTGSPHSPTSLRSFSFGGAVPLTEELIYDLQSPPYIIDRLWKGVGAKYKGDLPVKAEAFGAELDSWTEHFTLTPLCSSGKKSSATHFSWTASWCGKNNAVLEQLFTQAHTGPFEGLEKTYGTFEGC